MGERMYEGYEVDDWNTVDVVEDGRRSPLPLRFDLRDCRSIAWGDQSSGSHQLALALLADATGDDQRALRHAQMFKHRFVGALQGKRWRVSREAVLLMLGAIERDGPSARRRAFNMNMQPGRGRTR
jgi:hypothetical protein